MSYCKICGKEIPIKRMKVYCSHNCRMKGISITQNNYTKKKNKENPEKTMSRRYKFIIKNTLGNKCHNCGSGERLEIHEKTYENTTISDCVLLCKKCHMTYHYNWKFNV